VRRSRQGPYFYFLLDFYDQVFEEKKIGRFWWDPLPPVLT
jgi:hypothetical protein